MVRYFTHTHTHKHIFHLPSARENTNMRVKCDPHIVYDTLGAFMQRSTWEDIECSHDAEILIKKNKVIKP